MTTLNYASPIDSSSVANKPGKALVVATWTAQVLLGGMFIMAGFTKATGDVAELAVMMPWADDIPVWMLRMIAVSEILGGIGLILPALLKIKPRLVGYAALGLSTVMLLAAIFHIFRGEFPAVLINAVLGSIAAFIAWSRLTQFSDR